MAGGEDVQPHGGSAAPNGTPTPTPTPEPKSGPGNIQKTGEIMLGLSLTIILIVIICICIHLVVKQRRGKGGRRRRTKKKGDIESKGGVELHSVDKKVFEAEGTQVVLCELPEDAPPRQELDAGLDQYPISPLDRAYTGTTTSEMIVSPYDFNFDFRDDPWPDGRELATYWASR